MTTCATGGDNDAGGPNLLPTYITAAWLDRRGMWSRSTALRKMKSGMWGPWQKRPGLGICVTREDFIEGIKRECEEYNKQHPPSPAKVRYWEARRRREAAGWKPAPTKREQARDEAWERMQGPPQ